ncbi:hypothetical protein CKO12_12105 [Chromatium okenii]|nr:hypothetical protein [Chromatium okenii]
MVILPFAIQIVIAVIAGDDIFQNIAGSFQASCTRLQNEVFDIGAERVIDCAIDRIGYIRCCAGFFSDGVFNVIHPVQIVALTTDHRVNAGATIQAVIASAAVELVVIRAAVQRVIATATDEIISALIASQLVVTNTAVQRVIAKTTDERVIAANARYFVVTR